MAAKRIRQRARGVNTGARLDKNGVDGIWGFLCSRTALQTTLRTLPPTLPYAFDTTKSGKLILKGAAVIQAVLALDLPYILLYEPLKLIPFVLVSVVLVSLGVFVFKAIGGVSGTVTDRAITVRPSVLWGIRANGPDGSFPHRRVDPGAQ